MNDLFGHFAGGEFPLTATILVMAVVFVFIFLLMYVPALTKKIFPKFVMPDILVFYLLKQFILIIP